MSSISELAIMKLVDDHITMVNESTDAEEFIVILCAMCTELAFKEVFNKVTKPLDEQKIYKVLYSAIERIDQLWMYAGAHMRERHNADLFRYGALVLARELPIPEKYSDVFKQAFDNYADMLDSKTQHSNRDTNGELLREYFNIMSELGTFHADPNLYETEHQKELAQRMIEIYYTLVGMRTKF